VDAPQVWGGTLGADAPLAGDRLSREVAALVRGEDSAPVFDTLDLARVLACPADTEVATVCAPLWEDLVEELESLVPMDGDDDDSTSADDDDSAPGDDDECGCSAAADPPTPTTLMLAVLAAVCANARWRRRQPL